MRIIATKWLDISWNVCYVKLFLFWLSIYLCLYVKGAQVIEFLFEIILTLIGFAQQRLWLCDRISQFSIMARFRFTTLRAFCCEHVLFSSSTLAIFYNSDLFLFFSFAESPQPTLTPTTTEIHEWSNSKNDLNNSINGGTHTYNGNHVDRSK